MKSYSPLRYPGGKSQLAPLISREIIRNNLNFQFIEPYAGGAGVSLILLLDNIVPNIWINDIDVRIYSFWKSIINDSVKFCDKINNINVTLDEWYVQKEINKTSSDCFDLGFSTFFLNRTNFNGVIDARPMGGLNQTGKYKLDSRFGKKRLIKNIEQISKHKDKIIVTNTTAHEILQNLKANSFVFLDPPYECISTGLYKKFKDDSTEISELLKTKSFPWLLTYSDNQKIADLYKWTNCENFKINYSILNNRKKGKELFVWNNFSFYNSLKN